MNVQIRWFALFALVSATTVGTASGDYISSTSPLLSPPTTQNSQAATPGVDAQYSLLSVAPQDMPSPFNAQPIYAHDTFGGDLPPTSGTSYESLLSQTDRIPSDADWALGIAGNSSTSSTVRSNTELASYLTATMVPEPATIALALAGIASLAYFGFRKRLAHPAAGEF